MKYAAASSVLFNLRFSSFSSMQIIEQLIKYAGGLVKPEEPSIKTKVINKETINVIVI